MLRSSCSFTPTTSSRLTACPDVSRADAVLVTIAAYISVVSVHITDSNGTALNSYRFVALWFVLQLLRGKRRHSGLGRRVNYKRYATVEFGSDIRSLGVLPNLASFAVPNCFYIRGGNALRCNEFTHRLCTIT